MKRQRKAVSIAIDWHDQMYYGDYEKTPMVNGTERKARSSYAFQFLTVSLLVDDANAQPDSAMQFSFDVALIETGI